jgi:energy-coupling factor transporter ATP-binding protein EcfA2
MIIFIKPFMEAYGGSRMENLGSLILLKINNLKAITAAQISLDNKGKFVILRGDNGTGKSTVMDAIEALFNGGRLPDGLIKNGTKEATIDATFSSGYKAVRRIRKTKHGEQVSELQVTRSDGGKVGTPQSILQSVFAGISSPSDLSSRTGAYLYRSIVEQLPASFAELETAIAAAMEETKEARSRLNYTGVMAQPSEAKPDVLGIDDSKLNLFLEKKRKYTEDKIRAENFKTQIADTKLSISALERSIKEMQDKLEREMAALEDLTATRGELVEDMKAYGNIEAEWNTFMTLRQEADKNRKLIDDWKRYEEWKVTADAAKANLVDKEKHLEDLRGGLAETYASIDLPGGLQLTEDKEVLINGIPWENAAFSERVSAAAMLQISSLKPGQLPFVFIEHGESLNSEKRKEIAHKAIEGGAIVFIEILDENEEELIIEEGDVSPDYKPAAVVDVPPVETHVEISQAISFEEFEF